MFQRIPASFLLLPAMLPLVFSVGVHGQSGLTDGARLAARSVPYMRGSTALARDLVVRPANDPRGEAAIRGIVYLDADNNGRFDRGKDRPIAGATVMGDGPAAVSGADGTYSISDLGSGRTWLSVVWPGGQRTRVGFDLYAGGGPQTLNIGTNDEARVRPPHRVVRNLDTAPVSSAPLQPVASRARIYPEAPVPSPREVVAPTAQVKPAARPEEDDDLETANNPSGPAVAPVLPARAANSQAGFSRVSASSLAGRSTGDADIDSYILDSSRRHRVDPLLIYAQMGQESSYKKRAISNKGARGLMQLMPATAQRMGVTDIYDPQQNIEGGVKYMRLLLNMFDGDLKLALAGYNAGEGAVIKYGYQIPPYNETQDYVRRILARYRAISGSPYRGQAAAIGPVCKSIGNYAELNTK